MPAGTQRVLKQSASTLMLAGGGMGGKLSALQKVVFVGAQFSVEAVNCFDENNLQKRQPALTCTMKQADWTARHPATGIQPTTQVSCDLQDIVLGLAAERLRNFHGIQTDYRSWPVPGVSSHLVTRNGSVPAACSTLPRRR